MAYERRDDLKYMKRPPTHPGEMLREEYLPEYGLSVSDLACHLGVSRQTINELIHERRSMTPNIALRLQNLFGTPAEMWMDLQQKLDLWQSMNKYRKEIEAVRPIALRPTRAAI